MYLTAHRVRSRGAEDGINAFLHKHGDAKPPDMSWDEPDTAMIADRFPGSIVGESYDVPPGGNEVMSYLDVATVDSMNEDRVAQALEEFERRLKTDVLPVEEVIDGVGIRFGMQRGLTGFEQEEYRNLKERALQLLRMRVDTSHSEGDPLLVDVNITEKGFEFVLTEESAKRVRALHDVHWVPKRITVDHWTRHGFDQVHGDLIPHVIASLTGLRLEKVIVLGGVRLRLASTGQLLKYWPKK